MEKEVENRDFEPTIRAVTAFFAALIGFDLKHLLDLQPPHPLAPHTVPCFLIAIFLFLRFITGSANHLYVEHVKAQTKSFLLFGIDIAFIVIFGIVASFISYARNLTWFFGLSAAFLFSAIIWGFVNNAISSRIHHPDRGNWRAWRYINLVHGFIFGVAW